MLAALSTLRKRLGLNTRELAELTQINPSVIAKIEKGKRSATERQMALLERYGYHLEDYDEEGLSQLRESKLRLQMADAQAQMLVEAKLAALQCRRRHERAKEAWERHDKQLHLLQYLADQWQDLGPHRKEMVRSAAFKKKWGYKGPTLEQVLALQMDWQMAVQRVAYLETHVLTV